MYRLFKIGAILFLLLVLGSPIQAQFKFEQAVRFTTDDGLLGNSIRAVVQGPKGFIWVGTGDGLCRFDGSHFEVYQYDPLDSTSLFDNRIQCLVTDERYLWIGTQQGLSRMDYSNEKFTHYQFSDAGKRDHLDKQTVQQIRAVYIDRNGEFWVGTRMFGVGRYQPDTDDFRMYRADYDEVVQFFDNPVNVSSILSFEQHRDNDSIIWAGTTMGLLEINKYRNSVKWRHFEKDVEKGIPVPNGFRRMYHHTNGLLYAGTWGVNALSVYDPEKETLFPFSVKKSVNKAVPIVISRILAKSEQELWISSYNGMMTYHIEKEEITFWKENQLKKNEIYGVDIVDEQHRAWRSSNAGLFLFDPAVQQFSPYVYENDKTNYWEYSHKVGQHVDAQTLTVIPRTSDKLYHFDKRSGDQYSTFIPAKYLGEDGQVSVYDMAVAADGIWWVVYDSGLYLFDPESRTIAPGPKLTNETFGRLRNILWDSKGQLWLSGTGGAILRWNPKTKQTFIYKESLQFSDPKLYTTRFGESFEDSKGNIWFTRRRGYTIYKTAQDTFLHFLRSEYPDLGIRTITGFTEDKKGRVWFNGKGDLIVYAESAHPEKGIVQAIDLGARHPIGWTWISQVDMQGNIWHVANKLLIKIDGETLETTAYSYQYGISDPDFHSFQILPTGELAFGGRNAFWLAKPEDLKPNTELAQPYITGIEVLGKNFPTDTTSSRLKSLNLKAHQNFFALEFSALGFTVGNKKQFRYRLQGFTNEWTDAGDRRFASFTNVPGGDYTFQLQAANNEGVWNPEIAELSIVVATPWWASWWFRLLVLWFIATLAFAAYRYKTAQIRREEKLRADYEIKLADVEMSALRAQMNPHFLFNCLNSIESFIIKNETKKASEYLSSFARLIRLILQNSRSSLVNLKDELEAIELYMEMESLRFKDKFQYEINIDETLDVDFISIPPMLMQPYIENAIWHGLMYKADKSTGKVTLSVIHKKGQGQDKLYCIIEDNGVGREKAMQLKADRPDRGKKSVGMRITKDRINMINKLYQADTSVKVIDLKNEAGDACGTRIELEIPI